MTASIDTAPTFLPQLSAGRHRSPKRGACMMEYASFLAGERWSDHPLCTHPVLAAVARGVNDFVSDERRNELLMYVPRVIGLTSTDQRFPLRIALRAAVEALPIAAMERQHALAVGIRHSLDWLRRLDDADEATVASAEAALAQVPESAAWSLRFCAALHPNPARIGRPNCEATATLAVLGIADACVADTEERLIRLLRHSVEEGESFTVREAKRGQGLAA